MTPHYQEPLAPAPAGLRLWLWLVSPFVPRATRDDWMLEWLAECDIVLKGERQGVSRRLTLTGYAVGALPDALTVRALWVLDGVRWLLDGAGLMVAQPVPHVLAIVMLALPIASTVVMFQGARASVASRSIGPDIGVLVLTGLAIAAALLWTAARAAFSVLTMQPVALTRANAAARNAAAVVMAASLAVPLIVSGLARMAPTLLRAGDATAEAFRGDVLTGAAWAAVSYAMWKLRGQR